MKEAAFSANLNNTNERNQKVISSLQVQSETATKKKGKKNMITQISFRRDF